ncbi:hypothetical protein FE257_010541 [Aspergillus nanangensis]|uniref:Uncharacterized protein n=1 Tax=Aspergillus nanangensis TaxID=2582783 RepID=A0AAD4CIS4_ASPNN|nr:hypothetical protein FE257_010541 [Aspergillus nanangensis]
MAKPRRPYRNQGNVTINNPHATEAVERWMGRPKYTAYARDMGFPQRIKDQHHVLPPPMRWSSAMTPASNGHNDNALALAPPAPPLPHPPQDVFHRGPAEPGNLQPVSSKTPPAFPFRAVRAVVEAPERLFVEQYRYPGPQQMYEPPHFHANSMDTFCQQGKEWETTIAADQNNVKHSQLRGDAPIFVPQAQSHDKKELQPKEFTWMVVSST